ncbi:hypothetical protein I4I73_20500 [Pseudonocardia sp. KRD-184]|uniref:DUF4367 domain-containing protein n=1 Tax=Pseudonocardia oceani TaxID=2792013 RepID=A0ABS6U405_9PSEU|nr:hypothetical protein [Pseudonocardia oceani]MBW0091271.1 hypothetical protein [Pseudonocardia oceani]MBW0098370.1 hypothetical protein [Pseudonocardia oceani]MBW0110841.1 hypothetical protein [Pseudonocardia oceani]MBW0119768.1 hypothetical protein [Pseudonocardia oceani]MBW0126716.1 hypothetical protein [Pseudonocardia oceani]
MRHPTDGTLRRLLDEPAGVPDAEREHAAGCPVCLAALREARADADLVGAALGPDLVGVDALPAVDVDAAWARIAPAVAATPRAPSAAVPVPRRRVALRRSALRRSALRRSALRRSALRRSALRRPAVAVAAVAALLTGAGVAAASDWLPIFRTDRVAAVTVTQSDLVALPDLDAYGELELTAGADLRDVADADAAEEVTGLAVPEVRVLPRGVTGGPQFQAGEQLAAEFTFSAAEAARTAAAAGATLPPPPPGMDGARFRLVAGPGYAAVWPTGSGLPGLVVARAVAPTGYSSGIPFETARDYLLSLPGLPPGVADQLRGFSGDGTTLPLPLPAGEVTSTAADVGGRPATVLTTRDGALACVVWVRDGVVTAVAGSLDAGEVLAVARELGP